MYSVLYTSCDPAVRNVGWWRQGMELATRKTSSLNFNSTPTPHTREIPLVDKYFFFF